MTDPPPQPRAAQGLRIEGVDLSYGANHVLKGVDLEVRPGEFFAFLGPSGCGKTTLLRLIAGFNQADRGRVLVGGQDISRLPPWRRDVGMVFQSYALWPHMNVERNVAFGLEERRVKRAEIRRRVGEVLELVGLAAYATRRPSELSGGQQQRVALARTLAVAPKVLLLDEPLSNLDAALRVQVRRELRELQRRLGITTVFVTHDQEEANTVCDRMAVMRDGRVEQVGTPVDLYGRPANLFVAGFLGTANVLTGSLAGSGSARSFVGPGGWRLQVPEGVPAHARPVIRPQDLTIRPVAMAPPAAGSGPVAAVVTGREFLGSSLRYEVDLGGASLLADMPFRTGSRLFEPGQRVQLDVVPDAVLWVA